MNNLDLSEPYYGILRISRKALEELFILLQYEIFSKLLVVQAHFDPQTQSVEYIAWSNILFDRVENSKESPPLYMIEMDINIGVLKVVKLNEQVL